MGYCMTTTPVVSADELAVLSQLEDNFGMVKETAKKLACAFIEGAFLEHCQKKWKKGRKEYGGKFKLESIDALNEIAEEAQDIILYSAMILAEH
jgi:hypothetical protein